MQTMFFSEEELILDLIGQSRRRLLTGHGQAHDASKRVTFENGFSIDRSSAFTGVRIRKGLDRGRLQIGFARSRSSRLAGRYFDKSIGWVARGGSTFDATSFEPIFLIRLEIPSVWLPTTAGFWDEEGAVKLGRAASNDQIVLFNIETCSASVKAKIAWLSDNAAQLQPDDVRTDSILDRLSEATVAIIEAAKKQPTYPTKEKDLSRHGIACAAEAMLLQAAGGDRDAKIDLSTIAERLNVSKRTLQIALNEHFGTGFVELKRAIRLHQLRHLIRRNPGTRISYLARAAGITHLGRMPAEYRDYFGDLPSSEQRKAEVRSPCKDTSLSASSHFNP